MPPRTPNRSIAAGSQGSSLRQTKLSWPITPRPVNQQPTSSPSQAANVSVTQNAAGLPDQALGFDGTRVVITIDDSSQESAPETSPANANPVPSVASPAAVGSVSGMAVISSNGTATASQNAGRPIVEMIPAYTNAAARLALMRRITAKEKARTPTKRSLGSLVTAGHARLQDEGEKNLVRSELDERMRWNMLMTHTNLPLSTVTTSYFRTRNGVHYSDYTEALDKLKSDHGVYKFRNVQYATNHVKALIQDAPELATLPKNEFSAHLDTIFTKESFFACFAYIDDLLDFDACTDRGKWYLRTIYADLCFLVRSLALLEGQATRANKKPVNTGWTRLACKEAFQHVQIMDLARIRHASGHAEDIQSINDDTSSSVIEIVSGNDDAATPDDRPMPDAPTTPSRKRRGTF